MYGGRTHDDVVYAGFTEQQLHRRKACSFVAGHAVFRRGPCPKYKGSALWKRLQHCPRTEHGRVPVADGIIRHHWSRSFGGWTAARTPAHPGAQQSASRGRVRVQLESFTEERNAGNSSPSASGARTISSCV